MTDSTFGAPVPPQPSRIIVPGTAAARAPRCGRCGGEMPQLTDELRALARANPGVALVHEVCPGEEPKGPEGRYFEVRVQIVEVLEPDADTVPAYVNGGGNQHPQVIELISFKAGLREVDLDHAMRPLALALGEKWTQAEKQAGVADTVEQEG